mgnify:CR=1 FL=1
MEKEMLDKQINRIKENLEMIRRCDELYDDILRAKEIIDWSDR